MWFARTICVVIVAWSCFLLDQEVSISAVLDESSGGSDSEDGFPCVCSRERRVEFICEFHAVLVLVEFGVEEKVPV